MIHWSIMKLKKTCKSLKVSAEGSKRDMIKRIANHSPQAFTQPNIKPLKKTNPINSTNHVVNLSIITDILQTETKLKDAIKTLSLQLPFSAQTNHEIAEKMIMDLVHNATANHMMFGFDADSHSHLKKHPVWGYGDVNGPSCWGKIDESYGLAKNGKHQSPIDITTQCKPKVTQLLDEKE
eukprot:297915_1